MWKGFASAQPAMTVNVTWEREPLDAFRRSSVKRFNAEAHTQSAIAALLGLRAGQSIEPGDVLRVELETFEQALNIVGGGSAGDRVVVLSKEQADHSLPYLLAVALIDGDVQPEAFAEGRFLCADVQDLLGRVWVRQREELSHRYPQEMPAAVTVVSLPVRELTDLLVRVRIS